MRRTRDASRGQALVEFALILPILVLMLLGIFDLGRAVVAFNTINNAAREGARLAIVDQTLTHVQDLASQRASSLGVAAADITMDFHESDSPGTNCAYGPGDAAITSCVAVVTVPYEYTAITPIIGNIVGTITMAGEARFPVSHGCLDPAPDPPIVCPVGT